MPTTKNELAQASEDQILEIRWKAVRKMKKKGYARLNTSAGPINLEVSETFALTCPSKPMHSCIVILHPLLVIISYPYVKLATTIIVYFIVLFLVLWYIVHASVLYNSHLRCKEVIQQEKVLAVNPFGKSNLEPNPIIDSYVMNEIILLTVYSDTMHVVNYVWRMQAKIQTGLNFSLPSKPAPI